MVYSLLNINDFYSIILYAVLRVKKFRKTIVKLRNIKKDFL